MEKFKVGDVVRLTGEGWNVFGGETRTIAGVSYEAGTHARVRFVEPLWDSAGFNWGIVDGWELEHLPNTFRSQVQAVLKEIEDLLVEKNESYGDSALNPVRVFSDLDADERLNVRIDDKLQRLASGREFGQEDTVQDLMGYLVLKRVREAQRN